MSTFISNISEFVGLSPTDLTYRFTLILMIILLTISVNNHMDTQRKVQDAQNREQILQTERLNVLSILFENMIQKLRQ